MTYFFNLLVAGLMSGGLYGMSALGVIIICKATKLINFAQGEFLMVGAYFFYTLASIFKIPVLPSILLAVVSTGLFGVLLDRIIIRPLIGESLLALIMMTICLSAALKGFTTMIWGGRRLMMPQLFTSEMLSIFGVRVSLHLFSCFVGAIIVSGLVIFFFSRTRLGLFMRATAEGHDNARSVGIKVSRIFSWSWLIAGAIAAISGIFVGSMQGVDPELGHVGIVALTVAILGGMDSVKGALIGGFIVGATETLCVGYLDALVGGGLREVVYFVVMAIIVLIRPTGLFGLETIERI